MWVHPHVLSLFSFVIAAPGFYFYAKGDSLLGSLFILGAMFDSIDGAVAKKTGKTTKFGGVLDATLDRVFDGLILFFIGVGGLVDWAWLFLAFITFVTVSYIKAKTEAVSSEVNVGTNRFSVGIAQRGERVAIIFLASILNGFNYRCLAGNAHEKGN
jgi:phosphatidylglycerophosphate synthase